MAAVNIIHSVAPIAQTKNMSCWAAAAAMLLTWKHGIPYTEFAAAQAAGNNYVIAFQSNTGLFGTEIGPLAAALNLKTEAPQNYTATGYANLLSAHGPLWIGTAIFSSPTVYRHVRVLRGVKGDGTSDGTTGYIVDPDGGRVYEVTITDFSKELEEIAKQDLGAGAELQPQVIRFP
jgi:hypothetical protein